MPLDGGDSGGDEPDSVSVQQQQEALDVEEIAGPGVLRLHEPHAMLECEKNDLCLATPAKELLEAATGWPGNQSELEDFSCTPLTRDDGLLNSGVRCENGVPAEEVEERETQRQQQDLRYRPKGHLDPLGSKRAAMSVEILQNTLQEAVLEKDGLALCYDKLQGYYQNLGRELKREAQSSESKPAGFDPQRLRTTQPHVETRCMISNGIGTERAWTHRSTESSVRHNQLKDLDVVLDGDYRTDIGPEHVQGSNSAALTMKQKRKLMSRMLARWMDFALERAECRRKFLQFGGDRPKKMAQYAASRLKRAAHQSGVPEMLPTPPKSQNADYKPMMKSAREVELERQEEANSSSAKQLNRERMKHVMQHLKEKTRSRQKIAEHTDLVHTTLETVKMQRAIRHWHCIAQSVDECQFRVSSVRPFPVRFGPIHCVEVWKNMVRTAKKKEMLRYEQDTIARWRYAVSRQKKCAKAVVVMRDRIRWRILARTLKPWRTYVKCRLRHCQRLLGWLNRFRTSVLQRAWVQWQRQIVLIEHQRQLKQLHEDCDARMERLEMEFKQYRESQVALLIQAERAKTAQAYRLQKTTELLREAQSREHHYANAVDALCSSRGRAMTLMKCFRAWHNNSRRSKRDRFTLEQLRSAADKRRKKNIFSTWVGLTAQRRHLLAVAKLVASFFAANWRAECFTSWKMAKQQIKTARMCSVLLDRDPNMRICGSSVPQWMISARRVYFLRQTIGQLWLESVRKSMQEYISQWMDPVQVDDAKGQCIIRQAMLAAIQAKLWCKWPLFLQQLFFIEWREVVASRVRRRFAEQKLRHLLESRVLACYFHAWAEFAERQVQVETRNRGFARWAQNFQRRRLERGLSLWKTIVIHTQKSVVRELKEQQFRQEDVVSLQRVEITALEATLTQTGQKLVVATVQHKEVQSRVQVLVDRGLLVTGFNYLKLTMMKGRHQSRIAQLFRKNIWRRQIASLFSSWREVVWICHNVNRIAVENAKQSRDALLRSILQKWRSTAYHHRVVRHLETKLRQRISFRLKATTLEGWLRSIYHQKSVRTSLHCVDNIACRNTLKHTLQRWNQLCVAQRHRKIQKREKRKRIMAFVVGRQSLKLNCVFRSWQAAAQIKQVVREEAQCRYKTKLHLLSATVWKQWQASVESTKAQRQLMVRFVWAIRKYYSRVALARWKETQAFYKIQILELEHSVLSRHANESRQQVHATNTLVDRLSERLAGLQIEFKQVESKASALETQSAGDAMKQSRELDKLCKLNRVLVNGMVAKTTVHAFAQWKHHLAIDQAQRRALMIVVRISQRKLRGFAFSHWKRKTEQQLRFEMLQRRWKGGCCRLLVQRWKAFTIAQIKMRLVLTKRCLALNTGPRIPISCAFKIWKVEAKKSSALQHVATLSTKIQSEQNTSSALLRQLALGKWCWAAYYQRLWSMRRFFARCGSVSAKHNATKHRQAIEHLKAANAVAITNAKEEAEAQAELQRSLFASAEESLTSAGSFQGLKTLVRRLFQSTTAKDLFVSVSATFAQILHGSSATLFLLDSGHNEFWTQREDGRIIQVPASMGIAGSTLSSVSTIFVMDIRADSRFHPTVDQFVLENLQQEHTTSAFTAEMDKAVPTTKPTVSMLSSPIVSSDGAVYGVLQVAFRSSVLTSMGLRVCTTQTQLYSKTCCFYVEQILFEMLRNCRDRVRARTPDKFVKMFKQNKNWRKYYVDMEHKASEMNGKLHVMLEERERLIQANDELQKRYKLMCDKLEISDRSSKDVHKQIARSKQNLRKWQQLVEAKDRAIEKKSHEMEQLAKEFSQYRREKRTEDLQSMLDAPSPRLRSGNSSLSGSRQLGSGHGGDSVGEPMLFSNCGQLSILRANNTRLKSQLVRAEADNLLLVKAIDMIRSQHGELPRTIQAEVVRVAARVSSRSPLDT